MIEVFCPLLDGQSKSVTPKFCQQNMSLICVFIFILHTMADGKGEMYLVSGLIKTSIFKTNIFQGTGHCKEAERSQTVFVRHFQTYNYVGGW